jgi:hypothetical protein
VTEAGHDFRDPSKPIFPLVCNQNPQRAAGFFSLRLAVGRHGVALRVRGVRPPEVESAIGIV